MPGILFVGVNLQPYRNGYTPPSARIFEDVLHERGLRRKDVTIAHPSEAIRACRTHSPNVVVACGSEAAAVCIEGWASKDDPTRMRGYFFDAAGGLRTASGSAPKVLLTVSPEMIVNSFVPWRHLFSYDINRARQNDNGRPLARPTRLVEVITNKNDAERAVRTLLRAQRIAFDIEIADIHTTACVGFADSRSRAFVFPATFLDAAATVLESNIPKIAQNSQFDCHFLATRNNIRVNGLADDTLLAWHSCYPELAGSSYDIRGKRKGSKRTHKSLAFFASLFTYDAWWKDYDFQDEHEMFVLNGRDCCITFDVMEHLEQLIEQQNVRSIYEMEVRLVWPCVDMFARGLRVDESLRHEREQALEQRRDRLDEQLKDLVLPLLRDRIDSLGPKGDLFRRRAVCSCCRNGKAKRVACWSCAGFSKNPSKKELGEKVLKECEKCGGAGEFKWLEFNPGSHEQVKIVLYDVLKLPKRFKDNKLSSDAEALKGLLAHVN